MKVLIIEDEYRNAKRLQKMLLDYDATPAADGVSAVSTVGSRPVVYTVSGTQQRHPTAGISIVRDTDGQVRKAIRK